MMSFSMIDRVKNLIRESDVTIRCFVSVYWMMMMYLMKEELKKKEIKEKKKKKKKDYKLHFAVLVILWITLLNLIEFSDQNFF